MTGQLQAGEVIADRFVLQRPLGEGGMGAVWAATHRLTRKSVALKFLKSRANDDPHLQRRFFREARAASAVRHPNVVQIHDILELPSGAPVMVMDLLEGESLAARLGRCGRLSVHEMVDLLVPVISAVGTAHAAGIVHRDLKPDNIFLERGPDGAVIPKVLDFGIAKMSGPDGDVPMSSKLTQTGAMLGTPYYMAPEQAFGEHDVDHRADIWALGVILYECLAGKRPVDGDNLGQLLRVLTTGDIAPLSLVAPGVPEDLVVLVTRMLSIQKERRPQDLREVFQTLRSHARVTARSFDGAAPPRPSLHGVVVPHSPSIPFADTQVASSRTTSRSVQPSSPKRSRAALVVGGALVAAFGAVSLGRLLLGAATPAASISPPDNASSSQSVVVLAPPPAPPSAASAASGPSASAAVSTTPPPAIAIAGASRNHPPARKPPAEPQPGTPSATAAPPPAPLPGGVVGEVPF